MRRRKQIQYLDFEVEEVAVLIGSPGGLQVELGAASCFGEFGRFQNVVVINADESFLKAKGEKNEILLQHLVIQINV